MNEAGTITITGVVLAGGRATRMGGQDKGLTLLHGQALTAYVVQRLQPQVDDLIINANRNREQYQAWARVVGDRMEGFLGPLAGMLAAMEAANTRYILTVPCDSPLLAADYAVRMLQALQHGAADIAMAHNGERPQPVFALLTTALTHSLRSYLEQGERKIDRWFDCHRTAVVDFSDRADMFLNINTPQELAQLETRLNVPGV